MHLGSQIRGIVVVKVLAIRNFELIAYNVGIFLKKCFDEQGQISDQTNQGISSYSTVL
jgi:hypothetical protein